MRKIKAARLQVGDVVERSGEYEVGSIERVYRDEKPCIVVGFIVPGTNCCSYETVSVHDRYKLISDRPQDSDEFQDWRELEFGKGSESSVRDVECQVCEGSGEIEQYFGDEVEHWCCERCSGHGIMEERPVDFVNAVVEGSHRDMTARANALEGALIAILEKCDDNAGSADHELRTLVLESFRWAGQSHIRDANETQDEYPPAEPTAWDKTVGEVQDHMAGNVSTDQPF